MSIILDNRTGLSTTTLFYTNGTTRSTWEDVAWTDTSNTTLGFWKENRTDTTTNTTWWIKVPSIANDNTTKIRLFYGNATISTSYMNGSGTFPVFDDFPGTSVDTTIWTVSGSPTVANSALNLTAATAPYILSKTLFGQGYAVRAKATLTKVSTSYVGFADAVAYAVLIRAESDSGGRRVAIYFPPGTRGDTLTNVDNNYHVFEVWRDTSYGKAYIDNAYAGQVAYSYSSPLSAWIEAETSGKTNCDWIVVRKRVATEPFLTLAVAGGGGASAPVASFTVNKNMVRIPNNITVTDTTTNTPTSWAWSWGDGSANSTTQNPTHQYLKRGQWSIILTATNAGGSGTSSATNVKVIGYENYY